jgi:hypothetical protein
MKAWDSGVELNFASSLSPGTATDPGRYQVETWELVRSSDYGSERYNNKTLEISQVELLPDGKSVKLHLKDIVPVDVMTISYDIEDDEGNKMQGTVQNTIHNLREDPGV